MIFDLSIRSTRNLKVEKRYMIRIKVRFFGIFKNYARKDNSSYLLDDPATVETLMMELSEQIIQFKELFVSGLKEMKSNMIVIVNGREISVLQGLKTCLNNGDDVIIIPTIHGG